MAAKKQSPHAEQLKKLRATVLKLRADLVKEARQRKLQTRLREEAHRARARVAEQVEALRKRGETLARELKEVIGDASRRRKAGEEAMAKVAELRKELARKTDELKRKSEELAKLAKESAERARAIIREQPPAAATPAEPTSQTGGQAVPEAPEHSEN